MRIFEQNAPVSSWSSKRSLLSLAQLAQLAEASETKRLRERLSSCDFIALENSLSQPLQMNIRWKVLLFLSVALFDLSSRAQAPSGVTATHVADGAAVIDLPAGWLHSSPAFVAALNEKTVQARPISKTRFTEAVYPVIGSERLPDIQLLMIGKSPQSRPPLTPEKLVELFPQALPSVKKQAADMGAGFDTTPGTSAVHYNAKLRAVVNDATITFPSGELVRMRQYTVFSSASVVSFVAYSSTSSSETFFRDVDQIVGTTAFKEVDRLPESWFESVKKLFGSP